MVIYSILPGRVRVHVPSFSSPLPPLIPNWCPVRLLLYYGSRSSSVPSFGDPACPVVLVFACLSVTLTWPERGPQDQVKTPVPSKFLRSCHLYLPSFLPVASSLEGDAFAFRSLFARSEDVTHFISRLDICRVAQILTAKK